MLMLFNPQLFLLACRRFRIKFMWVCLLNFWQLFCVCVTSLGDFDFAFFSCSFTASRLTVLSPNWQRLSLHWITITSWYFSMPFYVCFFALCCIQNFTNHHLSTSPAAICGANRHNTLCILLVCVSSLNCNCLLTCVVSFFTLIKPVYIYIIYI